MSTWILLHAASTWAMVGVIWTIQLLHYPLMSRVPAVAFGDYVAGHQRRVVGVLALFAPVEVVSAAAVGTVDGVPAWLWLSSGSLLVAIWVATGAFYAPLHGRLADGRDERLLRRLVRANRWRTAAWTVRGVAAGAMLVATA